MGLRLKLGLNVVIFVSVVLAAMGYYWQRSERQIYLQELQHRGVTLLRAFAIPCTAALANNNTPALDNFVVQFAVASDEMDLAYLAVLDYKGRVAAHTTPDEFGKIYGDAFTRRAQAADEPVSRISTVAGEPLIEVAVPVSSGLRWGTLRAGFTLNAVEQTILRGRRRLIVLGLAIAIGAVAIAYWALSGLVVRPVLRMRDMARRFGAGELNARVALGNRDEMGHLADAMNSMAHQIQSYAVSLERLVEERTSALAGTNRRLLEVNERLERLARTDGLTGLYNRRYFMEQLDFELQRGARTPHAFALVLLDVDHFKHYNDHNGHMQGDELLTRLAGLLEENLRSTDVIARYGGEEFVILLLDTEPEKGLATAEKLRALVEAEPFTCAQNQPAGRVTVSVGVAFYPDDGSHARTLIDYADQALYESKARGRNRVTTWKALHSDVTKKPA